MLAEMENVSEKLSTGKHGKPDSLVGIARTPVNDDSEVEFTVQPGHIGEGKSPEPTMHFSLQSTCII